MKLHCFRALLASVARAARDANLRTDAERDATAGVESTWNSFALVPRAITALGVALATTTPAAAQSVAEVVVALSKCHGIAEGPARLACYDKVLTPNPAAAEAPKASDLTAPATWQVKEDKSPVDDSPQITAYMMDGDYKSGLVVRCREHKIDMMFAPQYFVARSDKPIRVLYRINSSPAVNAQWEPSTNGNAVFVPGAPAFLASLPQDGTLFLRAFDYHDVPHDALFRLGNVGEVREHILLACLAKPKPAPAVAGAPATAKPAAKHTKPASAPLPLSSPQ